MEGWWGPRGLFVLVVVGFCDVQRTRPVLVVVVKKKEVGFFQNKEKEREREEVGFFR